MFSHPFIRIHNTYKNYYIIYKRNLNQIDLLPNTQHVSKIDKIMEKTAINNMNILYKVLYVS